MGEWGRFEESIKFLGEASDATKPDNAATYRPKVTTSAPQRQSEGHSERQKPMVEKEQECMNKFRLLHMVNSPGELMEQLLWFI